MLEKLTSSTNARNFFFFPLREPKQRGMAGARGHHHLAKADVPAYGVSVLAVFWIWCFLSFTYPASARVSGVRIGVVEKLPFLFYHTRLKPSPPVSFDLEVSH